jgi:hypothetical protein
MDLEVHVFGKIVKVLANFVEGMISLPEKPESFQHLLLDLHLVRSKLLIDSFCVICAYCLATSCCACFLQLSCVAASVNSLAHCGARYQFQPVGALFHPDLG